MKKREMGKDILELIRRQPRSRGIARNGGHDRCRGVFRPQFRVTATALRERRPTLVRQRIIEADSTKVLRVPL